MKLMQWTATMPTHAHLAMKSLLMPFNTLLTL